MKKYTAILAVLSLFFISVPQNADAQISFGVGLSAATETELIGIQGNLLFGLPLTGLRVAAEATYYFPETQSGVDVKSYELNLNGHYSFFDQLLLRSYFLGGFNLTNVDIGGVSDSKAGANIGLGVNVSLGLLSTFLETKYVISEFDQFVATLGIRF